MCYAKQDDPEGYVLDANPEFEVVNYYCMVYIYKI